MPLSIQKTKSSKVPKSLSAEQMLERLFGRKTLRPTLLFTPVLPFPLQRQKRGWLATYDIPPKSPESAGLTVIRTGVGAESVTNCLGWLFSTLGPAARIHQYLFFGSAAYTASRPPSAQAVMPAKVLAADHQAFLEGRLSILYSQPCLGSLPPLPEIEPGASCLTIPGSWHGGMVRKSGKSAGVDYVDQETYWFVSFMNAHRISDYSVVLVPTNSLQEPQEPLQPNTETLSSVFKRLIEVLQRGHSEENIRYRN